LIDVRPQGVAVKSRSARAFNALIVPGDNPVIDLDDARWHKPVPGAGVDRSRSHDESEWLAS
jgi:hypothetical protein